MFEKGMLFTGGEWYITVAKYDLVLNIALLTGIAFCILMIVLINKLEENKKIKNENNELKSRLSISQLRLLERYEEKN